MYTINSFQHETGPEYINGDQWELCLSLPHISDTLFFVTAAPQEGKKQASVLKLKVLFKGLIDLINTKFG